MYLILDTESGGRGLDKTLMSVAMLAVDDEFRLAQTINMLIKPDNKIYHVTAEALLVNGINIPDHDKQAMCYKDAKRKISAFLELHSRNGEDKLITVGMGVKGDIDHICDKTVSRGRWNHMCQFASIDIGGLWTALSKVDKIKMLPQLNLWNMAHFFEDKRLPLPDHTALSDAWATFFVFKELMGILQK